MILGSSWSGGKDSCLAAYKAIKDGHEIRFLLNFTSSQYKRCCFHGIEANLLSLQAELVGIPLIQKEMSDDMKDYELEFKAAVLELKTRGIEGMVFGDVYLDEHKDWVERVCKDLEVATVEPLWKVQPQKVMEEFIEFGFKAIVISCKADLLGKDFVGRYLDREALQELEVRKICPCGENGEFHTFVFDGPIFRNQVRFSLGEVIFRDLFWFCDLLPAEWKVPRA